VARFEGARWRKSSYSGNSNACVEVANTAEFVGVRDSKARHAGTIILNPTAWVAFVSLAVVSTRSE
jgi:hypothetical protein